MMKVTDRTTANAVLPGKITPPEVGRVFARPALLDKFAELSATVRRVWISSPGGAGKTTLVRAFVAADPRPLVWYQVDVEDRDPANLFFYLCRAAPQGEDGNRPLPQLTPEYLPNFPVFCRNFFRAYFARFPQGCLLVFDDFQEGPGESFLAPALMAAMAELPANSALFVLSRDEPYASLARDRVNRTLAHLNWDELRLSPEETRSFLVWSQNREPSPEEVERASRLTQGWLAGLLLFLENPGAAPGPQGITSDRTDLLFDYFAAEAFAGLPAETRSFLLVCSFLPTVEAAMAGRLTGRDDADAILRALNRGNHFTFRISATPEVYRFHPLFRQFIQARATQEWSATCVAEIRVQAARLLGEAGQSEVSAELLIAAGAWNELVDLIATHAERLLHQGRTRTLSLWLGALPDPVRNGNAWLLYWQGCCLNAENPLGAREALSRAFELFESEGNATGSMLAWATTVYAIVVGWNGVAELDQWIGRFYQLRERYPEYPSPEIEALMVQGILQALSWRQPSHRDVAAWAERLRQVVTASRDRGFRILAGADLLLRYATAGERASARAIRELLAGDALSDEVTPLQKLIWLATMAFSETYALDGAEGQSTMDAARMLIAESGVHVADVRTFGSGVALALSNGDLPSARRYVDELRQGPVVALLDQLFLHYVWADLEGHEGRSAKALALAETAMAKADASGVPIAVTLACLVTVVLCIAAGKTERAQEALAQGVEAARGMPYYECHFSLLAAYFDLAAGRFESAHGRLRQSLAVAARQRLNFHPWRDQIMAPLCRAAVDEGIEVEYVRELAAFHRLDLDATGAGGLTPREQEILKWVIAGKTNREIGGIQGVSERTVKFHMGNILKKLGAKSRAHAVSIAMERGWVPEG